MSAELNVDVAIIGGGPAGSTCASFLMKYAPRTKVAVFERERFPRDHVGESQLPVIGNILNEIGVWDKVERAGFPVKIGATYRWGRTDDLWDFEFIPYGQFDLEARPAKFAGQRTLTSFQVDRAIYDKILLDHAAELGARVFEETVVRKVEKDGDRITSLTLGDGTVVKARYYVARVTPACCDGRWAWRRTRRRRCRTSRFGITGRTPSGRLRLASEAHAFRS